LKDLHEPGIERRGDRWINAFEDALDDLSKHLSSADWLNNVRRGKEFKKSRTSQTIGPSASESPQLNDGVVEDLGADKGKVNEGNNRPDSQPWALQQLRILAAAPPSTPGRAHVSHLVLCLEPHGSQTASLTEDQGFRIVPANVGCTFSVGKFLLPDSNRQDDVGNILLGVDDLEGKQYVLTL
jgi:1-phosphatidylinositol-3-phosphate 5-kinase